MRQLAFHNTDFIQTLRWTARFLSVASFILVALFFIGEGFTATGIAPKEWLGLFFFPVGVFAGMFLAWWNEGLGSLISILSLLGFYVIYGYLASGYLLQGWAFLAFGLPAYLFLICWLMSANKKER